MCQPAELRKGGLGLVLPLGFSAEFHGFVRKYRQLQQLVVAGHSGF